MKRIFSIAVLMVLTAAWATSGFSVTARQTRLYGTAIFFGDSLANAKVTVTLAGANHFYTSTQIVTAGQIVVYTDTATATRGRFSVLVFGTDSLFSSQTATYTVTIEDPRLQKGGMKFEVNGLSIAADGDSTDIRDVLAQ